MVRGEVKPDTNIVLITITSNDIDKIGPWPIKRSYYALLINSLSKLKVKKIGIEVFLTAKFATQTLYDNLLLNEAVKAGNVVFSSVAGGIIEKDKIFLTDSLSFPSPKLLNEKLHIGHLNYVDENGINIPIQIKSSNETVKSFSAELAGDEFYSKAPYKMELNINSSWKKFKHFSLLEFYKLVNDNSEELKNFENKRIIVGISDPQIAGNLQSIFDEQLPGLAIHAFALDNLINKSYKNNNLFLTSTILFLILLTVIIILQNKYNFTNTLKFYLITFAAFLFISFVLYEFFNIKLYYSLFALPLFVISLVDLFYYSAGEKLKLKTAIDETELLKTLLTNKEKQLVDIQNGLKHSTIEESDSLKTKIKTLKEE
ncbi:MAG: hypothetical protein CO128_06110, partial [Ignavibacteriales bacterium CG_4_9_14_3_um_filter_30_11]